MLFIKLTIQITNAIKFYIAMCLRVLRSRATASERAMVRATIQLQTLMHNYFSNHQQLNKGEHILVFLLLRKNFLKSKVTFTE